MYNPKLVCISLCLCVLVCPSSRGNMLLMAGTLSTALSRSTAEQQVPRVRRSLSAAEW